MGEKGVVISIFLGLTLILINVISEQPLETIFSVFVQALLFFIVALLVGTLSDEKSNALQKEKQFKLDTAHYFFNPISIAEGNLDLSLPETSGELREKLKDAQVAVQRIKKVVVNVIELGEIHE